MNVNILSFPHSIITSPSSFSLLPSSVRLYQWHMRGSLRSIYYFVILFFSFSSKYVTDDLVLIINLELSDTNMHSRYFFNCCPMIDVMYANYWLNNGERESFSSLVICQYCHQNYFSKKILNWELIFLLNLINRNWKTKKNEIRFNWKSNRSISLVWEEIVLICFDG
jgi:hypothetical protein